MNDDLGTGIILLTLLFVSCLGCFELGRKLERSKWQDALPKEMMTLCLQCKEIGEEMAR